LARGRDATNEGEKPLYKRHWLDYIVWRNAAQREPHACLCLVHENLWPGRNAKNDKVGSRQYLRYALYLRSDTASEERTLVDAWLCEAALPSGTAYVLTLTGARFDLEPLLEAPRSYLFAAPAGSFQVVVVSPKNRLFADAWSRALLTQMNRSLTPDGCLLLPFADERASRRKGTWSLGWLSEILGTPARVVQTEQ
jgi:hypothetical protein